MSFADALLADGYAGNLTTLRWLQLACGFTTEDAARFCLVSPETFRRWRSDRSPNPTAVRLLAIRAGYMPWPAWRGWQIHDGCLFPPGFERGGFTPGDLVADPLWRQMCTAQAVELRELRQRLASASWSERVRRRA